MADLFADVKVGDVVYWMSHGDILFLRRAAVTWVTKTRFECGVYVFRKYDGREVGVKGWRAAKCGVPLSDTIYKAYRVELQKTLEWLTGEIAEISGDEAIRLAALLPPELKGTKNG